MFYVYLMNSIKHNKIYIGFTSNLKKRFIDHNEGETGWTKRYRPWELVYYEAFRSEEDARKREAGLKNYGNALRELKKRLKFSFGGAGQEGGAGFTLIETLMVVFLMGIVLVAGGNIFFGIMKGASKAEVQREIKQNGEYALAIMERMIRNSIGIEDCSTGVSLTIRSPGPSGGPTSNQTIFQLVADNDVDKIASSSGAPVASNLFLTGDNVNTASLTFTCYPEDFASPEDIRRIGINFTLTPKGITAGEVPPEMYAEINFQTSISLRNFPR